MKTIFTTVGTSIFKGQEPRNHAKLLADKIKDKFVSKDVDALKARVEISKKAEIIDSSAEIETIARFLMKEAQVSDFPEVTKELKKQFRIHLIATDSVLSVVAAELIQEWMEKNHIQAIFSRDEKHIAFGFQVGDFLDFQERGAANLAEIITKNTSDGDLICASGGYKAMLSVVTAVGQVYQMPIFYKFEDTHELLEMPNWPVEFDYTLIEENYEVLKRKKSWPSSEFEQALKADALQEKPKEQVKLLQKKGLLTQSQDHIALTFMGGLLLERYGKLRSEQVDRKLNGRIMELLVAQYFYNQHWLEIDSKHPHGSGLKLHDFEYDAYFQFKNGGVLACEVKPGDNIPIDEEKEEEKSLEHKLKKGGLKKVWDLHKGNTQIKIVLYSRKPTIHSSPQAQIKNLLDELDPEMRKSIEFLWLRTPEMKDTNFVVHDNNLKTIDFNA